MTVGGEFTGGESSWWRGDHKPKIGYLNLSSHLPWHITLRAFIMTSKQLRLLANWLSVSRKRLLVRGHSEKTYEIILLRGQRYSLRCRCMMKTINNGSKVEANWLFETKRTKPSWSSRNYHKAKAIERNRVLSLCNHRFWTILRTWNRKNIWRNNGGSTTDAT